MNRAVLESLPHSDSGTSGHHVAGLRHPDAVERLLGHIHRGGELPLVACCAEDLEAVRLRVAHANTGVAATDDRAMPEALHEQHPEPRSLSYDERQSAAPSAAKERAFPRFLGVLLMAILIISIIWQLGLWGVTATLTSHAADEAARTASVGASSSEVRDEALRSVPSWFRDSMDVSQTALGTVKVTSSMPVLMPTLTVDGLDLTSEAPIVAKNS